jgi:PadR family transcriptional regulator PadR
MKERLRGNLDMLVLDVLEREPMHGYAVVRALRDGSGGVFELPEGTVYPSLHRLEAAGLLESDWQDVEGRRRRIYRVTPRGSAVATVERREWSRFAGAVGAVLARPV